MGAGYGFLRVTASGAGRPRGRRTAERGTDTPRLGALADEKPVGLAQRDADFTAGTAAPGMTAEAGRGAGRACGCDGRVGGRGTAAAANQPPDRRHQLRLESRMS